jgi:hypothetical protein
MEKFVKLDAIAKMAKPMEAFHGAGGMQHGKDMGKGMGKDEYTEGGTDWECPDCGTMVMATKEMSECMCPCCGCEMEPAEDSPEDEAEDLAEGETEED